jgi:hypothetical protein
MRGSTPIKSIRLKCLDCCGELWLEVKLCGATECTLWPYRLGKRPTADDTETHLQEKSAMNERNRLMTERLEQEKADRRNDT